MDKLITVKGVGTVSVKPDYIIISLNIASKDKDYSVSVEKANRRIELLQKSIVSSGFVKGDLKTLSFNVNTDYESEHDENGNYRRIFKGYECAYALKLSFDMDSKRLAQTLTAISESGADAELSIKFTVKNPEKISAELLRSAAENARQKAEILCAASDAKLGALVRIDYNWTDINVYSPSKYDVNMVRKYSAASSVPEFEPEDIKSQDTVAFIWEITT